MSPLDIKKQIPSVFYKLYSSVSFKFPPVTLARSVRVRFDL